MLDRFKNTLELIKKGRQGLNMGLYHGLPSLIDYVPGVQRENIYLIGGVTGSGKSALATNCFVFNPYEYYLKHKDKIKLKIFIWSIEISPEILLAKAVCRRIFLDHGILVDVNYILSRGNNRIDEKVYKLVESYEQYYKEFEDRVIINGPDNPTGIRNTILEYLNNHGELKKKPVTITHKDGTTEEKMIIDKYVPDHENTYIICLVDHLNILKTERGYSKKQTIDKLMEYMVELANRFKITPVLVQQLNRSVEQWERLKNSSIEPQISDFKESGDTTDAAHIILGMCYPQRWEFPTYRKYEVIKLDDRFRGVKVLKNRDGAPNIVKGCAFLGEIGLYKELPAGLDMKEKDYTEISSIKKYTNNGTT